MESYSVYIIYSTKLGVFYIGTTNNVDIRLMEHNSIKYNNAFTRKGIPWSIFLKIDNLTSKQALLIERHIKAMKSKVYIRNLNKYPEIIQSLREKYQGR